jgi:hypothetical protein
VKTGKSEGFFSEIKEGSQADPPSVSGALLRSPSTGFMRVAELESGCPLTILRALITINISRFTV